MVYIDFCMGPILHRLDELRLEGRREHFDKLVGFLLISDYKSHQLARAAGLELDAVFILLHLDKASRLGVDEGKECLDVGNLLSLYSHILALCYRE
jgi:hypothetical protein